MNLFSKPNKRKQGDKFSRLGEFIRNLAEGVEPKVNGFPAHKGRWRPLGDTEQGLTGNEALALEEILDEFCPNEISRGGNSRAVVDEWIQKCVLEVLDAKSNGKNLDERITGAIKTLKERMNAPAAKWEVWQFVEGLVIPDDGFKFGRASFHRLDGDYFKSRPKQFIERFEAGRKMLFMGRFMGRDFEPPPKSLLCRIYVDAADGTAAIRTAKAELNLIMGVLNFFAWPLSSNKTGVPVVTEVGKIPVHRTINRKAMAETIAFTEIPKPHFQREGRFYGHVKTFDIGFLFKHAPEVRKVFYRADSFLKGEGEKAFRERILTAMKWAGKGEVAENNEEAFLFFALALESLVLGGQDKGELRYRLGLRIAHLLGSTKQERRQIHKYTKNRLYDARSSLVHTGKASIPDSDLDAVRQIAIESIYKLMTRFQNIRDVSIEVLAAEV